MSTMEVTCLCGEVRMRLAGAPVSRFYCHCDDCRAIHGGAYVARAIYPADAVEVEGRTETFTLHSTPRVRCAACAVSLFGEVAELGIRGVNAFLLPEFTADFHIQCRFALAPVRDDLPHYRGLPAQFGGSDDRVDW